MMGEGSREQGRNVRERATLHRPRWGVGDGKPPRWGQGSRPPGGSLGPSTLQMGGPGPPCLPSSLLLSQAESSHHSCARLQGPTNQTQEHTCLVYGGRRHPRRGTEDWGRRQEATNSFRPLRDGNREGEGNGTSSRGGKGKLVWRTPRGEAFMCFKNNNRPSWGGGTCV